MSLEVVTSELRSASTTLADAAQRLQNMLSEVHLTVGNLLGSGWKGGAASAYSEQWDNWHSGAGQVIQGLWSMSESLKAAAESYTRTDEHAAGAVSASFQPGAGGPTGPAAAPGSSLPAMSAAQTSPAPAGTTAGGAETLAAAMGLGTSAAQLGGQAVGAAAQGAAQLAGGLAQAGLGIAQGVAGIAQGAQSGSRGTPSPEGPPSPDGEQPSVPTGEGAPAPDEHERTGAAELDPVRDEHAEPFGNKTIDPPAGDHDDSAHAEEPDAHNEPEVSDSGATGSWSGPSAPVESIVRSETTDPAEVRSHLRRFSDVG